MFIISANGRVTKQTGQSGEIKSLNYPDHYFYPSEYTHTWDLNGTDTNKYITIVVRDFHTEPCCDKVKVSGIVNSNVRLRNFSHKNIFLLT